MLIYLCFKMYLRDPQNFNGNRHSLCGEIGECNSGKQNIFNMDVLVSHKRNLSI